MQFKEVLITEDNATYSVKKEITAKVVIKTRDGFVDKNRNLCVVEDTGNGYIAQFPSFTSTQQDSYVCLDYEQAEYLMQAIAEFLGKEVVGKDEVHVKPGQEELVSEVAYEYQPWIRHDGIKQPYIDDDTKVDVKCRSGTVHTDYYANSWDWIHDGEDGDIVAWRYAK